VVTRILSVADVSSGESSRRLFRHGRCRWAVYPLISPASIGRSPPVPAVVACSRILAQGACNLDLVGRSFLAFVAFAGLVGSALAEPRRVGPDICKGHLWIHHLVSIQSESDSQSDPMSCSFDPESRLGKRVLAVCDDWGGSATHGCWIRGTFVVGPEGDRKLTGVFEVQKTAE
jgi:hypothetical protein